MKKDLFLHEGHLYVVLRIMEDGDVLLLHCAPYPLNPDTVLPHTLRWYRLVEIQAVGENQNDHHGNKHTGCMPGHSLRYVSHSVSQTESGSCLCITLSNASLQVSCFMEFFHDACTVRTHTEVTCISDTPVCLSYVSSFALTGLAKGSDSDASKCMLSWRPSPLPRLLP